MSRRRLPDRRLCISGTFDWGGRSCLVSVGFDRQGRAAEVFADGLKTGGEIEGLMDDACVLLSRLLQSGTPLADLAGSLGAADSPIGQAVQLATRIEAESGAIVRVAYEAAESPAASVGEEAMGERG